MRVPFSRQSITVLERAYAEEALASARIGGGGPFSLRCERWLREHLGANAVLLTSSGTHALEMATLLLDLGPSDEVLMPSFTLSSTANAVALSGARPVFVDIRPDTLNFDEQLLESAITDRTRAISVVHYGGVACAMDKILAIARGSGLVVIEDAAHGLMARYSGRHLGTLGALGCLSFHETKNCSSGEGGALLINDPQYAERAVVIRDKGTNRSAFLRGETDRYTWTDIGSSYSMSDLSAALLLGQLERAEEIRQRRLEIWNGYHSRLRPLDEAGRLERPTVPSECEHNGHIYYIKVAGPEERDALLEHLRAGGVQATFHFIPLHSSPAGMRFGEMRTPDLHTTRESERLIRLPLFFDMSDAEVAYTVSAVRSFFEAAQVAAENRSP